MHKCLLTSFLVLLALPAYAEQAGLYALGTKACDKAGKDYYAAVEQDRQSPIPKKELSRLLVLHTCACDERFSFEKPFSRCEDEKKDHEKEFGKETWK